MNRSMLSLPMILPGVWANKQTSSLQPVYGC